MTHNKRTLKQRLATAQTGQVIILMAFGMIALLGVLGLAIDGGRLYYLERDAQNAADAAVMAATYALCIGDDPVTAGTAAANENGFSGSEVAVNYPVSSSLIPAGEDPNDYVQVIIGSDIPSYFIHLVYGGDLAVATDALGQCDAGFDPIADGAAIVATHDCSCNKSIELTGAYAYIEGGMMTNGYVLDSGSAADKDDLGHTLEGALVYGQCGIRPPKLDLIPDCEPERLDTPFTMPTFYTLSDFSSTGVFGIQAAADGGRFYEVSGQIKLSDYPNGGLFYAVGDLDVQLDKGDTLPPITIVAGGNIHIKTTGNKTAVLTPYIESLLVFTPVGNSDCDKSMGIDFTGSVTSWEGLIYAPNAHVQVPGSTAISIGAVIADTVKIPGSSTEITYDYSVLPTTEATVSMVH